MARGLSTADRKELERELEMELEDDNRPEHHYIALWFSQRSNGPTYAVRAETEEERKQLVRESQTRKTVATKIMKGENKGKTQKKRPLYVLDTPVAKAILYDGVPPYTAPSIPFGGPIEVTSDRKLIRELGPFKRIFKEGQEQRDCVKKGNTGGRVSFSEDF